MLKCKHIDAVCLQCVMHECDISFNCGAQRGVFSRQVMTCKQPCTHILQITPSCKQLTRCEVACNDLYIWNRSPTHDMYVSSSN